MNAVISARNASPGIARAATAAGGRAPARQSFIRRIFVDTPEDSKALRAITLAASLWAALTVIMVGVPPVVPIGAMAALAAGHYVSYLRRRAGIVWLSLAIGLFIVVLGIAMRLQLVAAVHGDRVPLAYFLLATGAASSFDMRTRAGLYTQLIFSGIVMFFAGELAFGNDFALFLAVYAGLVVAFFTTGFWQDETREARPVSFDGPGARVTAATAFLVTLVALSVAAFMILPWNSAQTPPSQRMTIVPFGADDDSPAALTPVVAQELLDELEQDGTPLDDGSAAGPSPTLDSSQTGSGGFWPGLRSSAPVVSTEQIAALRRVGAPLDTTLGGDGRIVMRVRSPVASYWRAAAFDTFDPGWLEGAEQGGAERIGTLSGSWLATYDDDRPYASLFARRRTGEGEGDKYLQTFFIQSDVGGELMTGYNPVSVTAPRDSNLEPLIKKGTTYQVVSRQPDASSDDLRRDRAAYQGPDFISLPPGLDDLHMLTERVTREAGTDFDRAAAIASYLHQLEYDRATDNQLVSSAGLDDFVFGRAPGSSIDFATAMALMARSAGLPSRVATGYLPGSYNPFSGANTVTARDAHAWAEIAFQDAGWVPFDAAPRNDLPGAVPGNGGSLGPLASLLEMRLGDRIAGSAGRASGMALSGLFDALTNGLGGMALALVWLGAAFGGWLLWQRWRGHGHRRAAGTRYDVIPGRDRAAILELFRRAEALAARAGYRVRRRHESFAEYAAVIAPPGCAGPAAFQRLAELAGRAAFTTADLAPDARAQAAGCLTRLRAELRQEAAEAAATLAGPEPSLKPRSSAAARQRDPSPSDA